MDDVKRKELKKVLGTLESQRELDRFAERERAIEHNRHIYRFQEIKRSVILPTLREFMIDLEKQGHLTRIQEKTSERVRFDIQIQSREPRRGVLEIFHQRSDPEKVRLRYGWALADTVQEEAELLQIDAAFIAERMLQLLKGAV
ncbi:MAG TPA: hypothetical protein VIH93_04740 [Thermoanaerobaculia bacterium]